MMREDEKRQEEADLGARDIFLQEIREGHEYPLEEYEEQAMRFFAAAKRWGAHVKMEAHYSGAHFSHDFVYIEVGDDFCCCFEKDGSITSHPWDYNDFDYALQDAKTSADRWLAKRAKSEEE